MAWRKEFTFDSLQTENTWRLAFHIDWDGKEDAEELLEGKENGRTVYCFALRRGKLTAEIFTYEKDTPLVMETNLEAGDNGLEVRWFGYRAELLRDGEIEDEEWPVGDCVKGDSVVCTGADSVTGIAMESPFAPKETQTDVEVGNLQYWAPQAGKCNVGDCMPFFDGRRYHLFYLKDRHGHNSKWHLGAHQFAHTSTADMKSWTEHPMAVGITHPWEGSICTGSFIVENGIYYAFYAVRMCDRTNAKISWAVSEDGVHYTKSEKYFELKEPYEPVSARDPEVFKDADGLFHMVVTTSYPALDIKERNGCLAHLVSKDLENWEQLSPFMIPGFTDQPECTDYFEWNGWYYVLYSNYGFAKYRYSKQPFGPWIKPRNEVIDGGFYRVPKSAAFHSGRRILAGFVPKDIQDNGYGGHVVFRELLQKEDGTLCTGWVPEMLPRQKKAVLETKLSCDGINGYQHKILFSAEKEAYATVFIRPVSPEAICGLLFRTEGAPAFELRLDTGDRTAGIYPAHSNPFEKNFRRTLTRVDTGPEIKVEIMIQKGIWDCCINGERTLIDRLEGWENVERFTVEGFSMESDAVFRVLGY